MLDLMPTPALTEIPSTSPSPIPSHEGLLGSGRGADLGKITFEDYFPQIDLDDDEKVSLAQWFERDLRSCVKNVNSHRLEWAKYRAVYLLEYIEKFYPDMGHTMERIYPQNSEVRFVDIKAEGYFQVGINITGQ